jgi:hypothetical protein
MYGTATQYVDDEQGSRYSGYSTDSAVQTDGR